MKGAQQVGRKFGGSFGGALEGLQDVAAFAIGAPSWHRDNWITSPAENQRYLALAKQFKVPVIVDSDRSRTWIFTRRGKTIELLWRC